jgi:hypothetical protein
MSKKLSKRFATALAKVDTKKAYEPIAALTLLKETATANLMKQQRFIFVWALTLNILTNS